MRTRCGRRPYWEPRRRGKIHRFGLGAIARHPDQRLQGSSRRDHDLRVRPLLMFVVIESTLINQFWKIEHER
jgi:hypothetical protein